MTASAIERLGMRLGILRRYHRIDGVEIFCGPDTMAALLAAMGLPSSTEAEAAQRLTALEAEDRARPFPREILVPAETAARRPLPPWRLRLEDGATWESGTAMPGEIPPLPPGVHVLEADGHRALVVASPPCAPSLADLIGRPSAWGVTGALYGFRSARNHGVGDYEDLARLAENLAPMGAAFLGINPIHSRGAAEKGISPYSPSSRTEIETGHLALDRIAALAETPAAQALLGEAAPKLAAARAADLTDYAARRALAEPVLRAVFERFERSETPRRRDFEAWLAARPSRQSLQALFEALSLVHGPDWRFWPRALQDPDGPAARAFAAENSAQTRFHAWCQWLAEGQLADAQSRAKAAGMALGLYLDIAVGVRPGGAETWAERAAFGTGVSLGAPPDLLNARGQSWGLAPLTPHGLAAAHYAPFRRMLRTAMAHAGAVRIDHVIGLVRSYWVPENGAPGGFVQMPTETLMALIRIEAARANCLVIGEDLGTVPDGLRDLMAASGLLGCAIMPFERSHHDIAAPTAYRPLTLASFGTHDLPTLAGWWQGADIRQRVALGHLDGEPIRWAWDERIWARQRFCHRLIEAGLLPDGIDPGAPPEMLSPPLADAMHALLARASSALVAVQLDDVFGVIDQQNVPGTIDEVPNWRRRLPVALEELADHPDLARIAAVMRRERGP
ncbi:MAG: 4-alpha-glucanotransferase [Pseudomonadota bacterium]